MSETSLTEDQLTELAHLADRVADDPFFLSDCEGELRVWRETALTHVQRDESGTITMYSFPSVYRSTDEVIGIDLDTWDPGEDATDDKRRQDLGDLVDARAAVPALVAEVRRLRAELRIGAPWKCHVCGKDNHRNVCLICETDRPDPEGGQEA